jgi:hypothetical protein
VRWADYGRRTFRAVISVAQFAAFAGSLPTATACRLRGMLGSADAVRSVNITSCLRLGGSVSSSYLGHRHVAESVGRVARPRLAPEHMVVRAFGGRNVQQA